MPQSQECLNLAQAAPFTFGRLRVEPELRLVRNGEKTCIIEPRVMQLLVALHGADGHILSRDELIQLCWGGAVVGDNAIHRAVSQARKIAATIGDGSFEIESVRGVGYRLVSRTSSQVESPVGGGTAPYEALGVRLRSRKGPLFVWLVSDRFTPKVVGLAALGMLSAAFFLAGAPPSQDPRPALAVLVANSAADPAGTAQWAQQLSADLGRLSRAGTGFSAPLDAPDRDSLSAARNSYTVEIATERRGNNRSVDARIVAPGDRSVLWSGTFTGAEDATIREQLAVNVAYLLQCLLKAVDGGLERSLAPTYVRACEISHNEPAMERVVLLRRVMQGSPRFESGWAELSIAEARLAQFRINSYGHSDETAALTRFAKQHLQKAKRLDPAGPATFIAQASLVELSNRTVWDSRLNLYNKAISLNSEAATLYALRAGVLFNLGFLRDATADARRAVELDPLSPSHRSDLINLLLYQGLLKAALAQLSEAERSWPQSGAVLESRERYFRRYGDPREALAALEESGFSDPTYLVWQAYLQARHSGRAEDIGAAVNLSRNMYERSPRWMIQHLQLLGHFERVEEAYSLILRDRAVLVKFYRDPTILYRDYMRPLRSDPRFMQLAASAGVLQSWQRSGRWPDFCYSPDLPYDCREAAKATVASAEG